MIDPEFLALLVCPSSRTPLRVATAAEVEGVNAAVRAGTAKNRSGKVVEKPIESGLVPSDGTVIYPVQDGIPILLTTEAIPLETPPPAT